jgi:hypothetical protein
MPARRGQPRRLKPPNRLLPEQRITIFGDLTIRAGGMTMSLSFAAGPTQYLLGALVLKLETSCCTRDLPHLGP